MNKSYYWGASLLLAFCTSCSDIEQHNQQADRPIFTDLPTEALPDTPERLDLAEIQRTGTIIVGTLSGPDTYYEYHGIEQGLQFRMARDFAQSIGVKLRMEIAPDTTTLLQRLYRGEIDFIALEMPRWETRASSPNLRNEIYQWWKPERKLRLEEALQREEQRIESLRIQEQSLRASRPVYLDASKGIISAYDHLFMRYAHHAGMDWRLIAAICYQESGFDPYARSWAGAQGLMQLMPQTARSLGVPDSRVYDPQTNIEAGTRYLGRQQEKFSDIRNPHERIRFVLASYNGGAGHVRDAMALALKYGEDSYSWDVVSRYILKLSDPLYYRDPLVKYGYMRGSETEAYVRKIMTRWQQYGGVARAASPSNIPSPQAQHTRDGEFESQVKSPEEYFQDIDIEPTLNLRGIELIQQEEKDEE